MMSTARDTGPDTGTGTGRSTACSTGQSRRRGPYRVWKNRTKGTTFDVWQKAYNSTETGVSWDYPEFKGYHDDLYWAVIQSRQKDFVVATPTQGLFLRLFTPRFENAGSASAPFPPGDISFLHAIPPIGTLPFWT